LPQITKKSDSNQHLFATTSILGQPPSKKRLLVTPSRIKEKPGWSCDQVNHSDKVWVSKSL